MKINELLSINANVSITVSVADLKEFLLEVLKVQQELSPIEGDNKLLVSVDEACAMLNSVRSTLWVWEKDGKLLPISRVGKRIMYRRSDIIDFMMGRYVAPSS